MQRLVLFILPILLLVSIALVAFGFFYGRYAEERLIDDLARKARAVAESMELSVKDVLLTNNLGLAAQLTEKFETRERLQGSVIYDGRGQILAITGRFRDWQSRPNPYLQDVIQRRQPRGGLGPFKEHTVYSYAIPVMTDNGFVLGALEVIYDASDVYATLTGFWKRISVTLISLIGSILIIALFVLRKVFILPVQRLTEWFQHFQKGEIDGKPPIKAIGELGKLANEVEQVALSLRVARRAISDEANIRLKREEFWTESKLRNLIHAKLGEESFFVVSNREPFMHVTEAGNGQPKCIRPPSGVVTAIDPILRACGGTWIACSSGDADDKFVNSKNKLGVPPQDHRYILKRVWLSPEENQGYYDGFSNEGLWPLCHMTYTRPIFREADWQMYKKVNRIFADQVLAELPKKSPFIFIQDYHFTLLGQMIKESRPDATIALFWHIPWPNYEVFSICPYQDEILSGMLSCDLIGFHVQYHCNNFLETANRLLECRIDTEKFSVIRSGKEAFVRSFPISIDGYFSDTPLAEEREAMKSIRAQLSLEGKWVGLGVERIDYTKGIVERLLAIDRFLEKYPHFCKKFVFIQLAAPSRTRVKKYVELIEDIDGRVEKINQKYAEADWQPIIYVKRQFSADEIRPYYKLADMCIVSSLHDGMNLVAKEYVASKEDLKGTLILSRFTGAARELTEAVQINPYSIEEFADSIKFALEMPPTESKRRMESMREKINEYNIYKWAASIITELTSLKKV